MVEHRGVEVRSIKIALLAGCLTLVIGACGGGSNTGATGSGGNNNTSGGSGGGSNFCAEMRKADSAARATQVANIDQAGLRNNYTTWMAALAPLPAIAPAEIKADMTLFVQTEMKVNAELAKINYDFNKVGPEIVSLLADTKFLAASDRLVRYSKDVCGIDQSVVPLST